MGRSTLSVVISLFFASIAQAAWYPVFSPTYVQLRPGETVDISVHGAWLSGVSLQPFTPMTFIAEDPLVATIDGALITTATSRVRVTGHRPGVTRVVIHEGLSGPISATSPVIVVADQELPVAIRVEGLLTVEGRVTLSAASEEPDATFTWYAGRLNGVYTLAVGSSRNLTFVPRATGVHEYWVLMTSPRGAGAAGVAVSVLQQPNRRRAARH